MSDNRIHGAGAGGQSRKVEPPAPAKPDLLDTLRRADEVAGISDIIPRSQKTFQDAKTSLTWSHTAVWNKKKPMLPLADENINGPFNETIGMLNQFVKGR